MELLGHLAMGFGVALTPANLKSALLFVHLVGLALGLGTATLLDLMLARIMAKGKVALGQVEFIDFASAIVTAGLVLLWLSGLGLLAYYSAFDLAAMRNPKVWAKISVVVVLTLNGIVIHAMVLPLLRRQVGRGIFEGVSNIRKSLTLATGAISIVSWYVPMLLGVAKSLNFAVPFHVILLSYGGLLALAIKCSQLLGRVFPAKLTPVIHCNVISTAVAR